MTFFTGAEPDEVWPLVREFHYSRRMPANIQHCFALREGGGLFGDYGQELAAAIVFSVPPTRWSEPVLELSRLVRRPDCTVQLTSLVAFACKWLRRRSWPLVVSFADWTQNHHGGIYQAAGFNYGGRRERRLDGVVVDGKFTPGRTCNHMWCTRSPEKLSTLLSGRDIEPHYDEGKYLYWKPLRVAGRSMARRLGLQSLPYPKPNAARPLDERTPVRASVVQPHGAAPLSNAWSR